MGTNCGKGRRCMHGKKKKRKSWEFTSSGASREWILVHCFHNLQNIFTSRRLNKTIQRGFDFVNLLYKHEKLELYLSFFLVELWLSHVPHEPQYGDRNRTGRLQSKGNKSVKHLKYYAKSCISPDKKIIKIV